MNLVTGLKEVMQVRKERSNICQETLWKDGRNLKVVHNVVFQYVNIFVIAFRQGRRDDMESLGYAIWSIAVKSLPWHRSKSPYRKLEDKEPMKQEMLRQKKIFWEGDDNYKVKKNNSFQISRSKIEKYEH